jgi:hypothetical protein
MPSNDEDTQSAKLHAVARLGERSGRAGRRAAVAAARDRDGYSALWRICVDEAGYAVRLAAAQQLASGGSRAFEALQPMLEKTLGAAREAYGVDASEWPRALQRELALQGWILPLLTSSVGPEHSEEITSIVAEWLGLLLGRGGAPLSIEASWAQGFKYEANARPGRVDPAMRAFVRDQAALLAPRAQFWFSRISLLHALTLWRLGGEGGATREAAQRAVKGWHIDRSHPFVDEAAALCELALADGQPARHIWIDEAGVMSKLGPTAASVADVGDSMLWISQAAGWLALSARARRLVAEMVVLLNLADRTDMSAEERLRSVSGDLPGCMTSVGGRGRLRVDGKQSSTDPHSGCHEQCRLALCPYPAPGADLYRGELSEAFCREQLRILGRAGRRARWQKGQSRDELRRFWEDMEARARA